MADPPSRTYVSGTILKLTSHRPPEPFGADIYKQPQTPGETGPYIDEDGIGRVNYVFSQSPRERYEPANVPMPDWFQADQASLCVEAVLSFDEEGAQTVLCSVVGKSPSMWKKMGHDSNPKLLIAKFFDPLHYQHGVVEEADQQYAHEAAAYYQIHARRQHPVFKAKPGLVPKFYGSWTTTVLRNEEPTSRFAKIKSTLFNWTMLKCLAQSMLYSWTLDYPGRSIFTTTRKLLRLEAESGLDMDEDTDEDLDEEPEERRPQQSRSIRIVLMEFIPGESLMGLAVGEHAAELRKICHADESNPRENPFVNSIFASIVDSVVRLQVLGLRNVDLQPSSILVSKQGRVVFTNFSQAQVTAHTKLGWHVFERFQKPLHPQYLKVDRFSNLEGWFPPHWITSENQRFPDLEYGDDDYDDDQTDDEDEDETEDEFLEWTRKRFPPNEYTLAEEAYRISDESKWEEALEDREREKEEEMLAIPDFRKYNPHWRVSRINGPRVLEQR